MVTAAAGSLALFSRRICRAGGACLAAGFYLAFATSALGGTLCPGNYQVLPLAAWPRDATLNVPLQTNGAAGETRASAFRSGLQQAGIRIDQRSPIRLQLVFSVASAGQDEGVYAGLDWYRVDPAFGTSLKDAGLRGATLTFTAIANDDARHRNLWVATLNCRVETDDSEALALEIGRGLGQVMAGSIRGKK